jgi:hypothetical protein
VRKIINFIGYGGVLVVLAALITFAQPETFG